MIEESIPNLVGSFSFGFTEERELWHTSGTNAKGLWRIKSLKNI